MAEVTITIGADVSKAIKGLGKIKGGLLNFSQSVLVLNQAAELAIKTFNILSRVIKLAIKEGSDFTSQMQAIKAVTSLTAKEFNKLEKEARRIGKTTSFTATEAGKGMEALAKAGLNANAILSTTSKVMTLASAASVDLSFASDLVATSLNIFSSQGLKAQEAVDLMTKTISASPQNLNNLSESLKNSQATAAAFGISFKDLTVILGAMAEAGVKGERAGTALNGALTRLANPTTQITKSLAALGISIDEVNPLTNSFGDILDKISQSGADVNEVIKILGLEAGPKMVRLFQKGSKALTEFELKQSKANTALEASIIRLDSLDGDFTKLNSAISGVKIDLFKILEEDLRFFTQSLTSMVDLIPKIAFEFKLLQTNIAISFRNMELNSKKSDLIITRLFFKFANVIKTSFISVFNIVKKIINKLVANEISALTKLVNAFRKSKFNIIIKKLFNVTAIDDFQSKLESLKSEFSENAKEADKLTIVTSKLSDKQKTIIEGLKKEVDKRIDIKNVLIAQKESIEQLLDTKAKIKIKQEEINTANNKAVESIDKQTEALKAQNKTLERQVSFLDLVISGFSEMKRFDFVTFFKQFSAALPTAGKDIGGVATGAVGNIGRQIVGVGGAIEGFKQGGLEGAVIGFFTDLLLSNEKFQKVMEKISAVLVELLDPIIEALIPIFDELVIVLIELKPLFVLIGRGLRETVKVLKPVRIAFVEGAARLREFIEKLDEFITFLAELFDKLAIFSTNVFNAASEMVTDFFQGLAKLPEEIAKAVADAVAGLAGGGGLVGALGGKKSVAGSIVDSVAGALGFSHGGIVTKDRMINLPGMPRDSGLILAHEGERVISNRNQNSSRNINLIFNIKSLNPNEQKNEIIEIIERANLTGRLSL